MDALAPARDPSLPTDLPLRRSQKNNISKYNMLQYFISHAIESICRFFVSVCRRRIHEEMAAVESGVGKTSPSVCAAITNTFVYIRQRIHRVDEFNITEFF